MTHSLSYNGLRPQRETTMDLHHRIESALDRIRRARALAAEPLEAADADVLREALRQLREQLEGLVVEGDEIEVSLGVLDIIARTRDPEEALVRSLGFLAERLGVDASGLRLRDGDDYPYLTTKGFSTRFVEAETHLCAVDGCGEKVRDDAGNAVLECMCGRVIQGRYDPSRPFFTRNGSFWTNSTTQLLAAAADEDSLAGTRNRCNAEGYESVALIPLRAGDETFGLLQFNNHAPGKFTRQSIELLEGLSEYLARLLA